MDNSAKKNQNSKDQTTEKEPEKESEKEPEKARSFGPEKGFKGKEISFEKSREGFGIRKVQYGKYWTGSKDNPNYSQSTMYIFSPAKSAQKQAVIIHIHGGGFTSGAPFSRITGPITTYLKNGFHFVSMDYRQVQKNYSFFNEDGKVQDEELVNISPEGKLSLDPKQKLKDYKVAIGRQELTTKCVFDTAKQMEYLIANAKDLNLDLNKVGFIASSAGGLEANYLIWNYPNLRNGAYVPVSAVFTNEQLNYPVQNTISLVYKTWADEFGKNALLSEHINKRDCATIVANPYCSNNQKFNGFRDRLCNEEWNRASLSKFCDNFDRLSFGDLLEKQVWPMENDLQKGIGLLWNISGNMGSYKGSSFYLYVINNAGAKFGKDGQLNPASKSAGSFVHHALYAKAYGEVAEKAGINYVVAYPDFHNMKLDPKTKSFKSQSGLKLNYRSNFNFFNKPFFSRVGRDSNNERLFFHCQAMKKSCRVQ